MLGLSLGKLQLGSRKVKTFNRRKFDPRVGELEGETEIKKQMGEENMNLGDCVKEERILDEPRELRLEQNNISQLRLSAPLEQNPNYCEKSLPFGELTNTAAKKQPLNPCLICDKDFIYPSLLNHHEKSVHHNTVLLTKESKQLQCDSCHFSTPKLAFLKTHNKFMHPKV